ncbi:LysR family transcriptional regulator [Zavarzinia sp. CC-PAN008]|uniref:LysR family transcriptional regulator n=1 Tax=Zavarzinia sp. CC-PAN008 TaxID=3243332 RepID=UPI003F7434C9
MDLDAKPLRYFIAVAEESSFTRAASRLHVSQPSLSAQVRELERLLGFDLFIRDSRKVALTPQGASFIHEARHVVAETERMKRIAKDIRSNELRVGTAVYTLHIPERMALTDGFTAAFPATALEITNRNQTLLYRDLVRGEIDLALVLGLPPVADERALRPERAMFETVIPPGFERLTLQTRAVAMLLPAESPLARQSVLQLSDLAGQRVALLDREHGPALVDDLSGPLSAAGAVLLTPPERNQIAVEHYAQTFRIAAVTLGWFDTAGLGREKAPMVARPVAGLDVVTELALIRRPGEQRPAAQAFWAFAARCDLVG